MKQFFVQATYTNDTEGYTTHIEEPSETTDKSLSELYNTLRKTEKGRITKMYVDSKSKGPVHVGYCLTRKQKYENTKETYTEVVWFELLTKVKVMKEVTEFDYPSFTKGV
jgi:hypothetical protein